MRALLIFAFAAALSACAPKAPQPEAKHDELRKEIERPLNRAHDAEAQAKAQQEANDKALQDATGE